MKTRQELEGLRLEDLKKLSTEVGIDKSYKYRKAELIEKIIEIYKNEDDVLKKEKELEAETIKRLKGINNSEINSNETTNVEICKNEINAKEIINKDEEENKEENKEDKYKYQFKSNTNTNTNGKFIPNNLQALAADESREGIIETHTDGYGFLRSENYLTGQDDIYVSPSQIRRFGLQTGDKVRGKVRIPKEGEKFQALLYVEKINNMPPDSPELKNRQAFEKLIPEYPREKFILENGDRKQNKSLRIIDLVSPVGKGQRGLIVAPPKAGKTILIRTMAKAVINRYPDVHLIVLLIDERPEEVTDMKDSLATNSKGQPVENIEIIYSTFDEKPERHVKVAQMVLERSQRLVECGKDVVILLDSLTRLARAHNITTAPSGRTLSGGLDPAALYYPKKFFGSARNIRNGGSLTIIASALVETGSRMDDVIYEEFKGTGNMEIHLDRKLAERRIFPAIDIYKSGTRKEEILLTQEELNAMVKLRKCMGDLGTAKIAEVFMKNVNDTFNNNELVQKLNKELEKYENNI